VRCHTVAGQGGAVGPDLTTIGAQFDRAALIDSILYPSKVVREGYQQYTIETDDDEAITGALRAESADAITLIDAEGRTHQIRKTRVRDRRSSALSLMPEGLCASLTLEQFADLVAYVESLRRDPRPQDAKTP
jgi:putative heme-binding domain-containing protein